MLICAHISSATQSNLIKKMSAAIFDETLHICVLIGATIKLTNMIA